MSDPLRDIAEFRAPELGPFLPEESQVNPEVYGAELAWWLAARLAERGVFTSYPEYEDWGWYLEYVSEGGSEFAVHCGNVGGARDHWLLALHRHARGLLPRRYPPYAEAAPLVEGIRAVLHEAPAVSGLRWLYPPEPD